MSTPLFQRLDLAHQTLAESAKKLDVLATLFGEEDVVLVAFQDFLGAVKAFMAEAESLASSSSSSSSSPPALSPRHSEFRTCIDQTSTEISERIKILDAELMNVVAGKDESVRQFKSTIQATLQLLGSLCHLAEESFKRSNNSSPEIQIIELVDQQSSARRRRRSTDTTVSMGVSPSSSSATGAAPHPLMSISPGLAMPITASTASKPVVIAEVARSVSSSSQQSDRSLDVASSSSGGSSSSNDHRPRTLDRISQSISSRLDSLRLANQGHTISRSSTPPSSKSRMMPVVNETSGEEATSNNRQTTPNSTRVRQPSTASSITTTKSRQPSTSKFQHHQRKKSQHTSPAQPAPPPTAFHQRAPSTSSSSIGERSRNNSSPALSSVLPTRLRSMEAFLMDTLQIVGDIRHYLRSFTTDEFVDVITDLAWVERGLSEHILLLPVVVDKLHHHDSAPVDVRVQQLEHGLNEKVLELNEIKSKYFLAKREYEFSRTSLEEVVAENERLKRALDESTTRKPAITVATNAAAPPTTTNPTPFITNIASPPVDISKAAVTPAEKPSFSLPVSPDGKPLLDEDNSLGHHRNESDAEDIDYGDIFDLHQEVQTVEDALRRDKDVNQVTRLLKVVDDRQRQQAQRGLSAELKQRLSEALANTRPSTERSPPLSTIQDVGQLRHAAATRIQAAYRRYVHTKNYKQVIRRKMVAQEILDTEITYIKGLLTIYRDYVVPLELKVQLGNQILPQEKIDIIFFHIKEIMNIHATLLSRLERRINKWNRWKRLGDVFFEMTPQLEMYTHYVTNYERSLMTFEECQAVPAFRAFMTEVKAGRERLSLGFKDLLITPIQRIPRYVLLLKELLKYTDKRNSDFMELPNAIDRLQKVAEFINERKRESEKATELQQLHTRLTQCPFPLAQPGRHLIKEGEIHELSDLGKKKVRWLFVFNDLVVCTQLQRPRFGAITNDRLTYEYRWSTSMVNLQFGPLERSSTSSLTGGMDDPMFTHAIGLAGDERRILVASSADDLSAWLQALSEARSAFEQQIMNLRRRQKSVRSTDAVTAELAFNTHFLMRKLDMNPETDLRQYVDMDYVMRTLRDKLEQLDRDIITEQNVLNGLQRLDQVYQSSTGASSSNGYRSTTANSSNNSTKYKVAAQKESVQRHLRGMKADADRLNEVSAFLEMFSERELVSTASTDREYTLLIDRRDFRRVLTEPLDEKTVIHYIQLEMRSSTSSSK